MRMRRPYKLLVGAAALSLLATACGGEDDEGDEPSGEDGEQEETAEDGEDAESMQGGTLRVYSNEPAFLVPTAANDQPSILVIRQLYRGLVDYDADGSPVNDLAESIESEDNQTWTITIKEGHTFTNGEPVDADAFIRSWNYTADGDNAQNNAYFQSRIVGFEESQEGADELSGVTKVDDYTIEVELNEPFVGLPAILGYSGYFPVAQECLDNFEACNETPIGNGPYMIEGSWEHDVGITLVRNEDYAGDELANPDSIEYVIFADVQGAYAAFQANELDVMYFTPPERYEEILSTYADRVYDEPSNSFTYVGLPQYLEQFQNADIRRALSMAIDRQSIIDAIFFGARTPATSVVYPGFDGGREGICEYCEYDPERAAQLLEDAGGWQWGELELWANAGAGHEDWMQAVGDQIRENLGIDYTLHVDLDFPEYLEKLDSDDMTGAYRLGWGPDYPVPETYLAPLYESDNTSNYSRYSNEQFDEAVAQGDTAPSLEEAIPFYQQAEDIIVDELPVIPMFWGQTTAVWSENVEEFVWNPINDPEYGQMVMAQE